MTRRITKKQFLDLWWDEFCPDKSMGGGCMICGGSGKLDTRGKVFTAKDRECGGVAACICPNGRAIRRAVEAHARREART